jgi:hypothetical protein
LLTPLLYVISSDSLPEPDTCDTQVTVVALVVTIPILILSTGVDPHVFVVNVHASGSQFGSLQTVK